MIYMMKIAFYRKIRCQREAKSLQAPEVGFLNIIEVNFGFLPPKIGVIPPKRGVLWPILRVQL